MSAPLVVNTVEGTVWTRRPVLRDGQALYAPAAIAECPEFVMTTYAELEKHGIVGSADVLPVPVGPQTRTLDVVEEELTGANLSLFEEERENARLRLALASAQRGRRKLRARVAGLEAERHSTNEALADVTVALRAAQAPGTKELEPRACQACGSLPETWCPDCAACEEGCFGGFDGNSCSHANAQWSRPSVEASADKLTRLLAPSQALREDEPAETGGAE